MGCSKMGEYRFNIDSRSDNQKVSENHDSSTDVFRILFERFEQSEKSSPDQNELKNREFRKIVKKHEIFKP